jgi:hypothetical protein
MHHREEVVLVDRRCRDLARGFEHVDRAVMMEFGQGRAERFPQFVRPLTAQPFDEQFEQRARIRCCDDVLLVAQSSPIRGRLGQTAALI